MKKLFIIIYCCIGSFTAGAQTLQETKADKFNLFAFAGLGRATVKTNLSAPSKFPALEFRLGTGLSKSISNNFELRSRFTLGGRLKRDSNLDEIYGGKFSMIEENTANRNHYFMEIPLLLQFNIAKPGLGFRVGANFRQYFPAKPADAYSGQSEFGIITGAYYRLNDKMNIGFDYNFGLTKMFDGGGFHDGEQYHLIGRNQFAQLTFEIDL